MLNSEAPAPLEFYKNRFDIENNLTRNILKTIPPDKLDYRPHERSPSTGQVAWTIVRGLHVRVDVASQGSSDVIREPHPALAEIVNRFEEMSRRHAVQLKSSRWKTGQESASYASATALPWRARQATSSGFFTSTRSIIAVSFPPTCGLWAQRCHQFMAHRVTQGYRERGR
jgi:hypothetical protein